MKTQLYTTTVIALVAGMIAGCGKGPADSKASVSGECATTWDAVYETVIERHGCASESCHAGDNPSGGLDLSRNVAYDNLIYADSRASVDMPRILPSKEENSLLYLKLAAKTEEADLPNGAGQPMPASRSAIPPDELELVRKWIVAGAPKDSVVEGTQELAKCGLPNEADPNKLPPPPAPAADEGFQHVAGPWHLPADSEDEVCFATYYDLREEAPEWARFECTVGGVEQECVAYERRRLVLDSQSHHSILDVYTGNKPPSHEGWPDWRCGGGPMEGMPCDPTKEDVSAAEGGGDCGDGGVCQTEVISRFTCNAYGPEGVDQHKVSVGTTTLDTAHFPEGAYRPIPIEGIILWNSHAFNLTDEDTTVDQYNTFWYARPEQRQNVVQELFDSSNIFVMDVPPFETREYCATYTLPRYSHLISLNSHVHKRGVLWRTWMPPNPPDCDPNGSCAPNEDRDPVYVTEQYADPEPTVFETPKVFDQADPAERTLKYCAVFDNGGENKDLVKRLSELPKNASRCRPSETYCVGGPDEGKKCNGKDENCSGGGVCDACPVRGGTTTEDEMFILEGTYFVDEP